MLAEYRTVFIYWLIFMNLLGFALMGIDKKRAAAHQWRISEKKLFLAALLGGSLGSWLGMYMFWHKTRHWYFVLGIPVIFVLQIIFGYLIMMK